MVFWRKKRNASEQEQEERDDKLLHPSREPEIEPPTDAEEPSLAHDVREVPESGVLEELAETPVPAHTRLSDAREAEVQREARAEEDGGGWFSRLSSGLSKSTRKISDGIGDLITKRKLDDATLEQLEELLIGADLGPRTAARVVADFAQGRFGKEIGEQEVREALADSIAKILEPVTGELTIPDAPKPFVILVAGVNGVGKTTTIGKLAWQYHVNRKKKLVIGAGDTFRAAAIEQLQIWSERAHCPLVAKQVGADAAAVAFESYEKAVEEGADILMIDTAGRLHNKANLMAELQKIVRVLKKRDETAPHEVLLVLDATTGQNAHSQVEVYRDMLDVTGLVVTKLDGSARGGVVVSLADQFKLPIYAVGVGEGIEDLQPFHPKEYARALVGL
ncbi:MAG: signal recognition particle-docking protein FtsY [Alphaproteobacteria bacterium]|nr:signal recognition particle-docking protein FtsY [Alphaproteobacteria bacterium]